VSRARGVGPGRFSLWAPVLAYMALIFAASSVPSPPSLPGANMDKVVHVLVYAGLSALVVRALAGGWRGKVTAGVAALAALLSAAYGATDELHQYFVPRDATLLDLVADAVGAALAAILLYVGIIPGRR